MLALVATGKVRVDGDKIEWQDAGIAKINQSGMLVSP
jgi:hypothetical protein